MAVVAPLLAPEAADPAGAEAPTPSAPPRAAGLTPAGGTDRRDQPDGSPPAPAWPADSTDLSDADRAFRDEPDWYADELFADLFASADRPRHPDDGGGNSPGGAAAGGGEAAAPPASRPVDPGGLGAATAGPQAPAAAPPPNLTTLQMMAAANLPAAAPAAPPAALNTAASAAAANPGADTPGSPAADPLWVLDASNGTVFTGAAAHTFSTWSEDLRAQSANVSTPLTYSWDLSQAPDATNVSGLGTYRLQLTWASFTGAARSDTITLTTTDANNGQQTQALHFTVEGTDSPAFASSRPTTAATWPTVLTPDQLQGEATVAAGPLAAIGLQAGDVQASHDLPGYDPNVAPLALVYGSLGADPQPVFIAHYELPGVQGRPPSQVSAQLTLNGVAGPTVYWYTSSLTPGDILELPLQADASGLATGRYAWSLAVTAYNYPQPVTTTYSGSVNVINDRNSPFGAGWALANLERLYPVPGGAILELPGGRSLWFAGNGQGGFVSPAGDFSTLTLSGGTYTRTLPDGTRVHFDSSGKQTSVVDRNGNTTSFGWDGAGQLVSITDMNGLATSLGYTGGLATSITDPAGRTTQLGHDGSGRLTSITDPDGALWAYAYDAADDLTSISDARGYGTSISYTGGLATGVARADGTTEAVQPVWAAGRGTPGYESNATLAVQAPAVYTDPRAFQWTTATDWLGFGTAVQAADPLGAVTLAYRDPNGLAWLSADALGRRGRDFFDGLGNATKIVAADNSFEQYAYNGFSEPTRYTDALGNVTTYAYDGQGNLLTETLPDPDGPGPLASPVYTFTYTPRGFVRTATDPLGRTTTYGYDGRNRLASVTNPLGQSVTYGYDAASDLTSETNELAKTWAYTYDNMGRVLTEVLPDDNPNLHPTYTYVYDADGNRTGVTDPDGRVTTTSYDTMDRESVVTDPLLHTTTSYYDPAGNLMGVMDHQGHSISYGYDPAGRRTSVTDANGNQTTYAYDAAGQLVSETDPVLGATTFSYTRTGRLASRTDPLNHTVSYGYDLDGRQTSVTDALGHTTVSAYDADGRLTAVTDPNNGVVRYTYYADGSQASITDPVNNTTNYAYDAAGRLQTATDPLGHATAYAYDAAGRLTSITDRDGRTRTFSYNAEGWQTAENWLDGQGQPIYTISYAYDPAGRLTSVSDPDATCAYGYDAAGRLTAVDNAGTPGVPHVVLSYGYDAVNNRVSLTDSLGAGIQYTYDYGHRLTGASLNGTGLTGVFVSFAYDAHDRLTGLTRSGGGTGSHTITTSYSYDNADRLTGITDTDTTASTTLASYSYGYDAADRVTSYSGPEGSLAYSYDATNQLTGATGVRNESYSYDLNGNRTMPGYQTGPDNRLVSDGTYNYTYDNEGNTLTKTRVSDGQVTTFTWDHRNRLTEAVVKTSGGVTLNDEKFTYDANDHRIGTWANGAQQSWTVYDGDTPYLDFTGSGSLTTRYLSDPRAIDAFFAREDGAGNVAWLLTDKLGSVREVVDSGGTVLDAITYDSYGNILNETNAANGGSFKFTAGAYDSALGLTYLWHRYVANGHWLSEDPLGLGPDSNPNRYVDNSPTNSIDPDGLCPRSRWRGGCWPPPAYPCPPWGGMGPYGPPACFPPPPCWTPPAPKPAPTLPPGRLMPNADGIIMIPSTPAYRELRSELIEFINAHKVVVRGQAPDEDGPKRPSPYPSSIPETPRFFRFTPWFSPSQVDRRTHPVLWKFLNFYKGDAAFSGIMHVDPSYFEKKRDEESSIQVGVKFQWGGPKPPP